MTHKARRGCLQKIGPVRTLSSNLAVRVWTKEVEPADMAQFCHFFRPEVALIRMAAFLEELTECVADVWRRP
jgi:hypothetical protein